MSNTTCFDGSVSANRHASRNDLSALMLGPKSIKPFRAILFFDVIDIFSIVCFCQNDYAVLYGAFLFCLVPGVLRPVPRAYPAAVFRYHMPAFDLVINIIDPEVWEVLPRLTFEIVFEPSIRLILEVYTVVLQPYVECNLGF